MSSGPHQYAGLSVCSATGQPQQRDITSGGAHNSSVYPENITVLSLAFTASPNPDCGGGYDATLLETIHQA